MAPEPARRRSALIFALDVTGGPDVVYRVAVYLQSLVGQLAQFPGLSERARIDLLLIDGSGAAQVSPDDLLAQARGAAQSASSAHSGASLGALIAHLKMLPFEGGGFHVLLLLTRPLAAGWSHQVEELRALVGSVTGLCCGPDAPPDIAIAISKDPGGTRVVNPLDAIKAQFDSIAAWLAASFGDSSAPVPAPSAAPPQPASAAQWRVVEPADKSDPSEHLRSEAITGAPGWGIVAASRRGKLHAHEGTYRDDEFAAGAHKGWNLIAVAAGAGSCRLSRVGARVATVAAVAGLRAGIDRFWHGTPADAPDTPDDAMRAVMRAGFEAAHAAVYTEAGRRAIHVRDLSSTLLVLAHGPHAPGATPWLAGGQIGDGLFLAVLGDAPPEVLGSADKGFYSGETIFLPSLPIAEWEQHIWAMPAPPDVTLLLAMTDGVADDLVPIGRNAPTLVSAVAQVVAGPAPARDLLETIGYDKRDSADDRTLAVIYRTKGRS